MSPPLSSAGTLASCGQGPTAKGVQRMDTEIDAKTFWKAIGCRAIGVAVVTAKGPEGPAGFLALSATHLTASPPIMMVSIGLTTSALVAVREGNHFAINYVPKGRDDLAKEFGGGGALAEGRRPVSARRLDRARDGCAHAGGCGGRHRLPPRRDDRAPRHDDRPGAGRGLQRRIEGAADQLPRRLSVSD